uniref:odorant-binding protein-like n=1 Tax=Jaculus jaculus TaxID=51337 RepID=UPI001E1AF8AF|nr:odorant-binding protein-like [Jaculus jaculus]
MEDGFVKGKLELSGDWHTIAIASSNEKKIEVDGPLRLYMRHLECSNGCEELAVTFFTHLNGFCQKITTFTKHIGNGTYRVHYEGDNKFEVMKHTGNCIAFGSINKDPFGKFTKLVFLVGKTRELDEEQKKKLEQVVEDKGIPKENIKYVLNTDTGLEVFWAPFPPWSGNPV